MAAAGRRSWIGCRWWRGVVGVGALLVGVVGVRAQGPLLLPSAVAYDAAGDLYFVDTNRNQVFEVSLAGVLSVVAGTGVQGLGGDGGLATGALLNGPQGVAVGVDGTVYVADTGNQRVRSIVGGVIATFAGTGVAGFSGDGGVAVKARLSGPVGLAVDATGALLVCDAGNQRVRRVSGGVMTTFAGSGVEGFAGDGGLAVAGELDAPVGVAVAGDGRVLVADSHNQRVRVVGVDGVIGTLAGTGVSGFSGDGGAATAAEIALPRGVVVDAVGDVIFADSNNQRLRRVSAAGVISTIAGAGWQGVAVDGTGAVVGALNSPRGVGVSGGVAGVGAAVFADSPNRMVREVAANGEIYTIAVATPVRVSSVAMSVAGSVVYGAGTAGVVVAGSVGKPLGMVTVMDGGVTVGNAALQGGVAAVGLGALGVGTHLLSAGYAGDGLNPAAVSGVSGVSVTPASVVATANAATVVYGVAIPQVSGTSVGILAQDVGLVGVSFSAGAVVMDPVGTYPIVAALSGAGSGNYSLTMSGGSRALQIVPAGSAVGLQVGSAYAGLPLLMTADVTPATAGVPTGVVSFFDAGAVVATGMAVNGVASGTYLAPAAGSHTLTASYVGDRNFVGSSSGVVVSVVSGMPDFTLASGAAGESVQGGLIAGFPLVVRSVGGAFTGGVTFSVTGLQTGAVASFSPPVVVPSATGTGVMMNVATVALTGLRRGDGLWLVVCLPVVLVGLRRRRWVVLSMLLVATAGCGARTVSSAAEGSRSYALTVTATGTNLAGAIVVRTAQVMLTVE